MTRLSKRLSVEIDVFNAPELTCEVGAMGSPETEGDLWPEVIEVNEDLVRASCINKIQDSMYFLTFDFSVKYLQLLGVGSYASKDGNHIILWRYEPSDSSLQHHLDDYLNGFRSSFIEIAVEFPWPDSRYSLTAESQYLRYSANIAVCCVPKIGEVDVVW